MLRQDDAEFPKSLLLVKPPPEVLYARGDLAVLEEPLVAIVGSRKPSPYGVRIAYQAAYEAARAGLVVVSGMARGLDARAHRGALDAGGKTIAVLGTGVDVCYPTANRELYELIPRSGLLLSELPPGSPPYPWSFPARNRLIAGLAKCLLVVEGRVRGGTSNTVAWMQQIGKTVLAVPGRIDEEVASSPNSLLRDGARPYLSPQDLLDEYGLRWEHSSAPLSLMQGDEPCSRNSALHSGDHRRAADDLDLGEPALQAALAEMSGAEAVLYDLVTPEPTHVDRLAERAKLEPGLLLAALSSLEIKGLVTQLPGKQFKLAS